MGDEAVVIDGTRIAGEKTIEERVKSLEARQDSDEARLHKLEAILQKNFGLKVAD